MKRIGKPWHRALIVVAATGLLLAACSTEAAEPVSDPVASPEASTQPGATATVESGQFALTINVKMTDSGPEPASIFIPAGRQVQIVLRSPHRSEFHYKVEGLQPTDLLWISEPEEEAIREEGVSDDEHEIHHSAEFVPWHATSLSGIKPTGSEVHGYTQLGSRDVIRFVATDLGTYTVVDPLHPEFTGQVTVY